MVPWEAFVSIEFGPDKRVYALVLIFRLHLRARWHHGGDFSVFVVIDDRSMISVVMVVSSEVSSAMVNSSYIIDNHVP